MGSDHSHKTPEGDFWHGETVAESDSQSGDGPAFPAPPVSGGDSEIPTVAPKTGPAAAALPDPEPRYEHYEILRREDGRFWELGRGAMGATYKAFDTRLHCVVALKVVHSALLDKWPILRERFLREARTAASVRHPNVANVFHLGEQVDGPCFYAMEFIDGETLAERVRRRGRVPVLQALDIVGQINNALVAAEGADLIHRDIKPGNVMLVSGSTSSSGGASAWEGSASRAAAAAELVKLIDFGLARTIKPDVGSPLTAVGDFVGTPHYASPEQLAGDDDPLDIRSDIFSLGLTLWYLLTAQHPFAGSSLDEIQKLQNRALPVAQLEDAEVPAPVIDLLRTMLAKDPDKRPQNPVLLAERLARCRQHVIALQTDTAGAGSTITAAGVPYPAPSRLLPMVTGTLGFIVLAIVGFIVYLMFAGTFTFSVTPGDSPAPGQGLTAKPTAVVPGEQSVAVLPFENRSDDPRNAFLADGIQDDLLTSLAKIRELRVISRTSVAAYRERAARGNLREIAKALNVDHVLEGSVQRVGDRVRVTAHLIDARTDANVWAETYDKEFSDALTIQSDLAQKIATALRATLSPEEKERVETRATGNADAYALYLQGREFQNRPGVVLDNFRNAAEFYQKAIALDDQFAVAYARLSQVIGRIAFNYEPSDERYAQVLTAARKALELQPDLGEGHLALGSYYYWKDRDYPKALGELTLAARALPNDQEVVRAIGYVQRRQGSWQEARASFERAAKLGPRDTSTLEALARFHLNWREWAETASAYDRAIALAPEATNSKLLRGVVDFHWHGDLTRLRNTLAGLKPDDDPEGETTVCRFDVALLEGNYAEAGRVLDGSQATSYPISNSTPLHREYLRGMLYRARGAEGDGERARAAFERARAHYEDNVRRFPKDPLRHVDLGLLYAALGWRDAALSEGLYAAQLRPESADVISGSTVTLRLAATYALLDDVEQAMPLLEHLFTISVDEWNGFSKNDLRRRPEWAALRGNARYRRLVAGD